MSGYEYKRTSLQTLDGEQRKILRQQFRFIYNWITERMSYCFFLSHSLLNWRCNDVWECVQMRVWCMHTLYSTMTCYLTQFSFPVSLFISAVDEFFCLFGALNVLLSSLGVILHCTAGFSLLTDRWNVYIKKENTLAPTTGCDLICLSLI